MNKMTVTQLKWLRLGLTLLFIILGFIAPLFIVGDKINIVSELNIKKVSWVGILLLVSIAYSFKKNILSYINSLEYSWFKSFAIGVSKVGFIIIILAIEAIITLVLKTASEQTLKAFINTLDTFRYCIRWWCILSILAHLGVRPFMDRCTHYIAKEDRKNELREVLKE